MTSGIAAGMKVEVSTVELPAAATYVIPAATDVQYVVEASGDLASWSSTQVEPIAPPPDSAPGTLAFRAVPAPLQANRLYLRLRVLR